MVELKEIITSAQIGSSIIIITFLILFIVYKKDIHKQKRNNKVTKTI